MTVYSQLRAPVADNEVLCVPDLADVGETLRNNISRFLHTSSPRIRSICPSRQAFRREVLKLAAQYLADEQRDLVHETQGPLFLAGHQPELFHPGVWLKNFVLARLAKSHGGIGLNLIVDNDEIGRAHV